MATGDILSVTIGAEGWFADVTIEGFTTGASYNFGLGASNEPTAATPFLTVVSEGYNSSGVLGTITRTVYLTTVLRKASPNEATLDETSSGGNLVVRVALSDFVYDDDNTGAGKSGTAPTFTAPAGWVTNAGGASQASNAATAAAVTNSSTLDYPVVIARWSRPDRERQISDTLRVACVAGHAHYRQHQPVACVIFTATDTHAHSSTATVTHPSIDDAFGDAHPVIEHIGDLDISAFTDDDTLTVNFIAYPFVGDANSIYDTAALAENEFTGKAPPQYFVLDRDGSLGYPVCVVDPVGGNNGTGAVASSVTNLATAQAAPYLNLYAAIAALAAYNNTNNGRNNPSGGTVYLAAGTTEVAGATSASGIGGVMNMWIRPLPGVTTSKLAPSVTATDRVVRAAYAKFIGCAFERSSDAYFVRAQSASTKFSFEDCSFVDTRTSNTYSFWQVTVGAAWFVRCSISKVRLHGLRLRGCTMPFGYDLGVPPIIAGCDYTQSGSLTSVLNIPSSFAAEPNGNVIMCNYFRSLTNDWSTMFGSTGTHLQGAMIVQNVVELLDTGGEPGLRIAADSTTSSTNHCVIAHNTFVGQRCNLFYNDNGAVAYPHLNSAVCLNAFEYFATKGDTFTGGGGANGARTGNWAVDNGVRTWGNRNKRGAFDQRQRGLWSIGGTDASPIDLGYTDDNSGSTGIPTGSGTGNGDYHPTDVSVLRNVAAPQMFAWDIEGNERATIDAAGAYRQTPEPAPASGSAMGGISPNNPGGGRMGGSGLGRSLIGSGSSFVGVEHLNEITLLNFTGVDATSLANPSGGGKAFVISGGTERYGIWFSTGNGETQPDLSAYDVTEYIEIDATGLSDSDVTTATASAMHATTKFTGIWFLTQYYANDASVGERVDAVDVNSGVAITILQQGS